MSKLPGLVEAVTRLESVWADADDATGLSRAQLIAVNDAIGVVQRRLDATHADVAARIACESRTELGSGSLAKEHGYRTVARMLAATGGISAGDASRLVKVGEATAPRTDLLGAKLPARYALLRDALASGALSVSAAGLIIALLDRCRVVAGVGRIGLAEEILAERCAGLGLDDVRKLIARAEAWLDPDGVQPKDEERRAKRSCTIFERDGMVHLNAVLDAETAAPVVTALRGVRVCGVRRPEGCSEPGCGGCGSAGRADAAGRCPRDVLRTCPRLRISGPARRSDRHRPVDT